MLLRSSSTPILGSLLHSSTSHFSESPTTIHNQHPRPSLHTFSCHLSNSGDRDTPSSGGVRRTRSDGNLHDLLSDHTEDTHHHHHQSPLRCSFSRQPHNPVLETIPSFSIYQSKAFEEEDDDEEEEEKEEEADEQMQDQEEMDYVPALGHVAAGWGTGREFSFSGEKPHLGLGENTGQASGAVSSPLFLARGLGIDRLGSGLMNAGSTTDGGSGSGSSHHMVRRGGNEGEQSDIEMYYKRMIEEDPSNAVFLRNYALFLYQTKGDLQRAEEYFSRAILAEPGDGDILSQYAKLVWELHHDEERASSYFERAVQAAPRDSHVLAAYAGFLWEAEDEDCV